MNFSNEVDSVKKTLIENAHLMRTFENSCKEEIRDIMKKFNDEIEKERLEMGEALIGLKTRQKRLDTALRKINNESHTLGEFEAKYMDFQKTEDEKCITVKLLSEFADFKQEMLNCPSTSNADDDTEIAEEDTNVFSMYDPWTKGLMLNPVRNINCGHHYDRDSVMAAINDNLSVKCPIIGCVSKIFVQPNHLVSNEALKKRIHTYKAQQVDEDPNDDN